MYVRTSIPSVSRKAKRERASGIAVKTHRDGREECLRSAAGNREYARRRAEMVSRQLGRCAICRRAGLDMTFGHECCRSGGKRDDRIWDENGKPKNAALCMRCNRAQGSRRYQWLDGSFIPACFATIEEWIAAEEKR